jgi:predicted RNase H-like HicB family nuclease
MKKESKSPKFTISYNHSKSGGFHGIVNEVPGVASQGETVAELIENLKDALAAMFEANRKDKIEDSQFKTEADLVF